MKLYKALYHFWTGFDLDRPLHSHTLRAELREIQALIPKIKSINFYKKKVFQCYQRVEECYARLLHTSEIKKAHLEILKYLANQATELKFGAEAIVYAKKTAELTVEAVPNKETKIKAEGKKIREEENEFTPLLSLSKRRDSEKSDDSKQHGLLRKRLVDHAGSVIK